MDGRGSNSLSDAWLDRELRAALNVDPSPEFAARVRMRVAAEPVPAGWRLSWPWLSAAAVAALAVVVAAVSTWRSATTESVPPAVERPAVVAEARPREVVTEVAEAVPPRSSAPVRVRRIVPAGSMGAVEVVARVPDVKPPFREVVFSADETRALNWFIAAVNEQRLPPIPPPAPRTSTGMVELPDLEIAPLVFEPLPLIARLETGEVQ